MKDSLTHSDLKAKRNETHFKDGVNKLLGWINIADFCLQHPLPSKTSGPAGQRSHAVPYLSFLPKAYKFEIRSSYIYRMEYVSSDPCGWIAQQLAAGAARLRESRERNDSTSSQPWLLPFYILFYMGEVRVKQLTKVTEASAKS